MQLFSDPNLIAMKTLWEARGGHIVTVKTTKEEFMTGTLWLSLLSLSLWLSSFRNKRKVGSKVPRLAPTSSTAKIPSATVLLKMIGLGTKIITDGHLGYRGLERLGTV